MPSEADCSLDKDELGKDGEEEGGKKSPAVAGTKYWLLD